MLGVRLWRVGPDRRHPPTPSDNETTRGLGGFAGNRDFSIGGHIPQDTTKPNTPRLSMLTQEILPSRGGRKGSLVKIGEMFNSKVARDIEDIPSRNECQQKGECKEI